MPKPAVVARALRRQVRPRSRELPNGIEGRIAELCRDLAVQAKRLQQLQGQADELRGVIRQWLGDSDDPAATSDGPRAAPNR